MSFKFNIALDAMGGENAPFKVVEGLSLFLKDNKSDVSFTLFGKSKEVFKVLKDFNIKDDKRVSVVNCENVISNELSVRDSIKLGKDTSMWKSIESVKENKCDIIMYVFVYVYIYIYNLSECYLTKKFMGEILCG